MKQGNKLSGLGCLCFLLLLSACGPGAFNTTQTTTLTPPPYLPFPTLYHVQALSQQSVWAVGGQFNMQGAPTGGIIVHYDGQQWVSTAVASPLFGVSMLSSNDGWAVGFNGTILHYDGHTWDAFNSPTSAVLRSVVVNSANNGWAVGYGGTLLHYDGHAWKAQNSSTTANLYSIAMYTDSSLMPAKVEGWAVGASGTLLHYAKGSWTNITAPSANTLYDVYMLSTQQVWAVGQNGTVIRLMARPGRLLAVLSNLIFSAFPYLHQMRAGYQQMVASCTIRKVH